MPVLVGLLVFVGSIASLMVLMVQRLLGQGGCFQSCRLAIFELFGGGQRSSQLEIKNTRTT